MITSYINESETVSTINGIIENKRFHIELTLNSATKKMREHLPLNIRMADLNGNEKYAYLLEHLPTQREQVRRIEKGDVMLFGSNCLVIFYQTFSTNYSYTKIGKIKEVEQLDFMLETDAVNVLLTP